MDALARYFPNVVEIPPIEFWDATVETLYMGFWTSLWAGVFGLGIGVLIVITKPDGILEIRFINDFLDKIINVIRAIPFIILLSLLAVFTRLIIGTAIGAKAALVPLVI